MCFGHIAHSVGISQCVHNVCKSVPKLLIAEEEGFSEQQKASLVEVLPDVIVETPKTNLAVVRLKKGLASAGKFTADAIRQFAIDFGCEFAKKSLGL